NEVMALQKEIPGLNQWPFRASENAEFRKRLLTAMQEVCDTYTISKLTAELSLFPLLHIPQRYESGHDITKGELELGLKRTLQLLERRLRRIDLQAFLSIASKDQIARAVRAARKRKGDTQDQGAETCKVTVDSFKSWESGRSHPQGEHIEKLAAYITSAY